LYILIFIFLDSRWEVKATKLFTLSTVKLNYAYRPPFNYAVSYRFLLGYTMIFRKFILNKWTCSLNMFSVILNVSLALIFIVAHANILLQI
jgi:hypothetical protein